jgi:hypothetical protein
MNQWLEELFREIHPRATPEEIENDIKQKPQEATARYLAFLGLLAEAIHFPPIKLVGDAERPGRGAIEVDLVLDVGNSRTCGLLIEAAGELGVNLNDSYELRCATSRIPRACTPGRSNRGSSSPRPGSARTICRAWAAAPMPSSGRP